MLHTLTVHRLYRALAIALLATTGSAWAANCPAFLDHEFKKLRSEQTVNICKAYAGKPLLIVNTASHCGFTSQFKGLQELHEKYRDRPGRGRFPVE